MFRKILYLADFSDTSKKVIPYLKYIHSVGKIHETEKVVILHVVDAYLRAPFLIAASEFLAAKDKVLAKTREAAGATQ
jgi:hypothetical protein